MQSQIIKHNKTDYTNILLAKVNSSPSNRIIIQIEECDSDQLSVFDLLLLQRSARKRNARLALVSKIPSYIRKATLLGIPVFPTISKANQAIWRRKSRHDVHQPITASDIPLTRTDLEKTKARNALKPDYHFIENKIDQKAHRVLQNNGNSEKASHRSEKRLRSIMLAVVISSLIMLLAFILPKARITISIPQKIQSTDLDIHASQDIKTITLNGGIPLKQKKVVVQKEDQILATGSLLVEDTKAKGVVELTNLTEDTVQVPAGTIVIAIQEPVVRFKTIEQGVVPAGIGETLEVRVEALEAGTGGNIAAGEISAFAGSTGLYVNVKNPEPMIGGADKVSTYPSEADYQELKSEVLQQLKEEAAVQLINGLDEGEQLVTPSIFYHEIIDETRYPEAGEPADYLNLSIRAEFEGWTYNTHDIQLIAASLLDANLEDMYSAVDGTLQIENQTEMEIEDDIVSWNVNARRSIQPAIRGNMVYSLAGQPIETVCSELAQQYQLTELPEVEIFPPWAKRLPYLASRIILDVE